MRFRTHSHRHSLNLFQTEAGFSDLWSEVQDALASISDDDLIVEHLTSCQKRKSISKAINYLVRDRLEQRGWVAESPIFQDPEFNLKRESTWRLDFAKRSVSIEVAFNHGEATAWNFLKPVLASEKNHIEKAITTEAGMVITATQGMKAVGGFDGACGTYENFQKYLSALNPMVTVPILLIGLEPPEAFQIEHLRKVNNAWRGDVRPLRPLAEGTLARIPAPRDQNNRLL